MNTPSPKLVVVVSDLHCGSTTGLCPANFRKDDGSYIRNSPIRKWLWDRWIDATTRWLPGIVGQEPFILVINGDCTEGLHHRDTQLVTNDLGEHKRIACEVLFPFTGEGEKHQTVYQHPIASRIYLVRGTDTHVSTLENDIGFNLGAETDPDTGIHCWETLRLRVGGILCSFQHHVPAALREHTQSTQYSVQMSQERARHARFGLEVPRVFVRSHRHTFGAYTDGSGLFLVTFPWQLHTRFATRVTQSDLCPVGLHVLDFRNIDDPSADLPTHHFKMYEPRIPRIVE